MKKTISTILISIILTVICGCSFTDSQNVNEDKENRNVGMINPWIDVNEDQATKGMTNPFKAPEGAKNIVWQTFVSDSPSEQEVKFVQLLFTMDGADFCAREYEGIADNSDISGMYYDWTITDKDTLSNWGDGGITCTTSSYVRDDNDPNSYDAMLVEWYDPEKWIKYSLSATGKDLNGLDLVAIADMMRDN